MWSRGEIVWAAHTGMCFVSIGIATAGLVIFEFILVPLTFAYFFTFVLAPVMNILEFRQVPKT